MKYIYMSKTDSIAVSDRHIAICTMKGAVSELNEVITRDESRAAELEARIVALEAERDGWKAQAAQLHKDVMNGGAAYVAKCYTVTELQRINGELLAERDKAQQQLSAFERMMSVALNEGDGTYKP